MSDALALAAVTAVVKRVLEDGLAARGVAGAIGGDVSVSALPPDRAGAGAEDRAQIDVFLYHVTAHPVLRGAVPAAGERGRPAAAPLALELHYLLTAYGTQDLQSEILLGRALQLLHATPVLRAEDVAAALAAMSDGSDGRVVPPALAALRAFDAAAQATPWRITPTFPTAEDAAKLWSALQARYRLSAAFKVSPVSIGAGRAGAGAPADGAESAARRARAVTA